MAYVGYVRDTGNFHIPSHFVVTPCALNDWACDCNALSPACLLRFQDLMTDG
jgi:hypothetical protein